MRVPIIETLSGSINGVNLIFRTSNNYRSGTVKVFRNGMMGRSDLSDGWVELGSKRIMLKEAPVPGDVLQAYYIPA